MEKRLNTKIEKYLTKFKQDVADKIKEGHTDTELLSFIYEYNGFEVETTDFQKRKRSNNAVPICDRCCAKRSNGEQCTRRKQANSEYCGTHVKGTPNGIIEANATSLTLKKLDVWTQEINGILYYIDATGNVYSTEDILENKTNPKIIATYQMSSEGVYNIDSMFQHLY